MKYVLPAILMFVLAACADVNIYRTKTGLNADFRVKKAVNVSAYTSEDGYKERKAMKDGNVWRVKLPYEKSFRYFLKVDGKVYLPECSMHENDDFGGKLCVYEEE